MSSAGGVAGFQHRHDACPCPSHCGRAHFCLDCLQSRARVSSSLNFAQAGRFLDHRDFAASFDIGQFLPPTFGHTARSTRGAASPFSGALRPQSSVSSSAGVCDAVRSFDVAVLQRGLGSGGRRQVLSFSPAFMALVRAAVMVSRIMCQPLVNSGKTATIARRFPILTD
jgi:hypothetical protein